MVHIVINLFILFLFSGSLFSKNADPTIKLIQRNLNTEERPKTTKDESRVIEFDNIGSVYSGFFVQDSSNRVWFFNDSEIWFFPLNENTWKYYGRVEGITDDLNGEYDVKNDRFILWQKYGSAVMHWKPGSPEVVHVTKNESYKVLSGHNWFVNSTTANLYTFGGRGNGIDHGTMYYFNPQSESWRIVGIEVENTIPPPRKNANSIYLPSRNEFHVFSGLRLQSGRLDISGKQEFMYDYWIFDVNKSTWTNRSLYGIDSTLIKEIRFNSLGGLFHERPVQGAVDDSSKLIWYLLRSDTPPNNSLLIYDIESGFGVKYPYPLLANVNQPIVRFLTVDQSSNELLVFWNPFTSLGISSTINVTAYTLPDPTKIRSYMKSMITNAESNTNNTITVYKVFASIAGLISLIGILLFHFKKRINSKLSNSDRLVTHAQSPKEPNPSVEYIVDLTEQPRIFVNSKALDHEFTPTELHLLIWLSWKASIGETFQITDTIEDLFFNDFPNLDYSRKHRNITIKRINEQLHRLFIDYLDREIWIIDRPVLGDKRKREYGLDLGNITISVRYANDKERLILPGLNYTWVDNIRKDLLSIAV